MSKVEQDETLAYNFNPYAILYQFQLFSWTLTVLSLRTILYLSFSLDMNFIIIAHTVISFLENVPTIWNANVSDVPPLVSY